MSDNSSSLVWLAGASPAARNKSCAAVTTLRHKRSGEAKKIDIRAFGNDETISFHSSLKVSTPSPTQQKDNNTSSKHPYGAENHYLVIWAKKGENSVKS